MGGLQPRLREVQVEVRPETSQPLDLAGELLRLQGYSIEVLQLAGGRQNHIGFPRPSRWNFLGLFLARADRLQARPHLIGVRRARSCRRTRMPKITTCLKVGSAAA